MTTKYVRRLCQYQCHVAACSRTAPLYFSFMPTAPAFLGFHKYFPAVINFFNVHRITIKKYFLRLNNPTSYMFQPNYLLFSLLAHV